MAKLQPWSPADATDQIRAIARSEILNLILTTHAREQMFERDLIAGDVLYILKEGFVLETSNKSTRPRYFKYEMESRSPNSGSRKVRVVAIPDPDKCIIKIVTVMWVD